VPRACQQRQVHGLPQVNTMSTAKNLLRICFVLAFAVLAVGCSSTANDSAPKFNAATGAHPQNWQDVHYLDFISKGDQCRTCHGSDLQGGVSGVTCFQCHHPGGPSHQAGWELPAQHGRNGAQLAPSDTSGFAYCQKCHGPTNFADPIGVSPSCMACHKTSPHPGKPWSNPDWTKPTHVKTDQGNVAVCAKCHTNGANSDLKPTPPAPTGTAPGCFNNTLCHGTGF
jgi:hypothetical protein